MIGFLWLVVLLSHAVLSHCTSLSIFMMLSLTCVECWECWSSICRYPYYYLALSFYPYTDWVPIISVLNLVIFPCYSNLLLRRRRWTRILRWRVLDYVLPRLPFLWSYRVFRCSILLRVVIVFRDITYVIILLYLWHLVICEHFWSYVWNNWSWVMHTMSTWFWHKN
jgi:hypothetical protein